MVKERTYENPRRLRFSNTLHKIFSKRESNAIYLMLNAAVFTLCVLTDGHEVNVYKKGKR